MKESEQYSDIEIIRRINEGQVPLFEILIRRNNSYLYRVGRSYNYNHEDTQDLMQETFIDAFINLEKFEGRSSFKTWIIRIMLNNCFRRKQKLSFKTEAPNEITDNSSPMFHNRQSDTGQSVANLELGQVIEKALQNVPEDYRVIFSLREISGLNVNETAEVLAISEANVKVRLNRAKSMLRKEIEKSYSPEDIFEFNLIYCDAMVNRVMKAIGGLK
ncbi:MAG: sigma-70 family RNA polymerase sigma factor [Flavobacterium sp.]|nr:MAG: sigma-70 family RNA polymerase sigma factor [Flavobacterium sp.]